MKTVYLHIGNFKTGTSAIQAYCSKQRKLLQENGMDYLAACRSRSIPDSHAQLPLSLFAEYGQYTPPWYRSRINASDVLSAMKAGIDGSPCDQVLISSEEFYRIAGLQESVATPIMDRLAEAFSGHQIRIVFYVKPPLPFLKSWYNQANKAPVPIRRFTDFVYGINSSLLVPQKNAELWRKYFGSDSLHIEPYVLTGSRHLEGFLEILGLGPDASWSIPDEVVNPKRREDTMELDRVARILTLSSESERQRFLQSEALADPVKLKRLENKVQRINQDFINFCKRENIAIDPRPITLEDLQRHETLVNGTHCANPGTLRRLKAQIQRSSIAASLKSMASN